MQASPDSTERILRDALAELWPEVAIESEPLGFLLVLSVRPPGMPRDLAPVLRLSWIRGEGHVIGTVHTSSSSPGRSVRVDEPGGDPRVVVEAAVAALRRLTTSGESG
jgi:hypothetical protein